MTAKLIFRVFIWVFVGRLPDMEGRRNDLAANKEAGETAKRMCRGQDARAEKRQKENAAIIRGYCGGMGRICKNDTI